MDDDAKRGPGRGGYRTGGGRPRGAKNNRHKEIAINAKVTEMCDKLGIDIAPIFQDMNPIELQMFVMRFFATAALASTSASEKIRIFSMSASVAEKLAPFLYPKQASVTQDINIETSVDKLSAAEIKARLADVLDADFELVSGENDKLLASS